MDSGINMEILTFKSVHHGGRDYGQVAKKSPKSVPPPAKKVKMTEERRAANRAYELETWSRHFIPDWMNGRPWLHYDESNKLMYCLACVRFPNKSRPTT